MSLNLFKYYKENINDDDFYSKFKNNISYYIDSPFIINNEEDAILRFRESCYPPEQRPFNDAIEFLLICYFLRTKDYEITQFPNQLERPKGLFEFAYRDIRNYLKAKNNYPTSTVPWKDRYALVNSITFIKKLQNKDLDVVLSTNCEERHETISIYDTKFNDMTLDGRLVAISGMIENILMKDNGKYMQVDEQIFLKFISNEDIRNYRIKIHCFRHHSQKSIDERTAINEKQKLFLIDYGLAIINTLENSMSISMSN